ncbi:laccase, multicopper oxidase, benzenediol:oxygen oxidorectuctase [Stygiomarasmius scandens]|uniref:Laccase, multicopper oxidase, benzenediol:oxygen oxidorectuctase n=1 Tax=Marasmiellus scandens TaxID=2682957 RepID=A0ABR1J036_9AGAR
MGLSVKFLLLAFAFRSSFATTIGPVTDLVISSEEVSPDGFNRTAALAGGTVIGPLIVGNKGDNFQINVVNQLDDDTMLKTTSIHWHGIFQDRGSNWADGPAFINQCPVASGNSFLYNFDVPDQAGTFWYHSHLSTQYCDGLRGPMVLYDPNDPYADLYDVDDESTVITLADWYHAKAETLTFPAPDSTLINGLGRFDGGNATELAVITVQQGKRYRMRLINLACDPNFTFSIDNHTMTVIEADGVNHEQLVVDQIQIFVAQRYSFILNANQSIDNYWIRANPNTGTSGFSGGINSAILRYVGADENSEPGTPEVTSTNPLVEANLVPLENPGAPGQPEIGGVDLALNLDLTFTGTNFEINGVEFVPPTVPVLLQILSGAQSANDLLPTGSVYNLPLNSTIEISMPAGVVGGPHPFHLHGHVFDVVRSAGSSTYNYVNPPRRDVVSIGASGDNVTIRFTTDNAGPWFLHCHIDWHLEAGFAIVFAEGPDAWNSTITPSDAWSQLCPIYDSLDSSQL